MKVLLLLVRLWLPPDIHQYTEFISGRFSTQHQSIMDSTFDNVSVYTKKIREDAQGTWIYTEQGEAKNYTPYRQRVYLITRQDSVLLQRTFLIKDTGRFSITNADIISTSDLEYKQGCDIIIRRETYTMYKGSTDGNSCTATFRGSTYTTSTFMVTPHAVVSWERGWDNQHRQIWGSLRGYYIYEKLQHF
jgi:hypothetical protein